MPLPGLIPSPSAVTAWLRRLPGYESAEAVAVEPADGGVSNLTCRVTLRNAPAPAACLRLQRARGIFEPYDVIREGEVLRCLEASALPTPRLIASERDPALLGAPFILTEWIDAPHMGVAGPDGDFGAFTRAVAAVHAVDWQALGLDFLGVPSSAAAATLGELEAVEARMPGFGCDRDLLLGEALSRLRVSIPRDGFLGLCQGDINVFNYLFRRGEVVGIVDWEQARIGDLRSDIGQLVALSELKGASRGPADAAPFVLAYQAASGRTLRRMAYFRALWYFELAVIYHGWMAFNDSEPWYSRAQVEEGLRTSLAEL